MLIFLFLFQPLIFVTGWGRTRSQIGRLDFPFRKHISTPMFSKQRTGWVCPQLSLIWKSLSNSLSRYATTYDFPLPMNCFRFISNHFIDSLELFQKETPWGPRLGCTAQIHIAMLLAIRLKLHSYKFVVTLELQGKGCVIGSFFLLASILRQIIHINQSILSYYGDENHIHNLLTI